MVFGLFESTSKVITDCVCVCVCVCVLRETIMNRKILDGKFLIFFLFVFSISRTMPGPQRPLKPGLDDIMKQNE